MRLVLLVFVFVFVFYCYLFLNLKRYLFNGTLVATDAASGVLTTVLFDSKNGVNGFSQAAVYKFNSNYTGNNFLTFIGKFAYLIPFSSLFIQNTT